VAASTTDAIKVRPPGRAQSFQQRLRAGDDLTYIVTLAAALTVLAVTALLVYELYVHSALSRHKFGWSFLITRTWDPVAEQFGALPFIYGTVVTSVLALLLGIPLGVGAAIFLAELAPPKISSGLTFLIELLAAVPSVIFGLLGACCRREWCFR
jgi:phosphate transport system permease protein